MKYLTLSLGPTQLVFHPVDRCLAARTGITRVSLLHLSARFDETYVVLYQLTGDHSVIEETVRQQNGVLDCITIPIDGDSTSTSHRCGRSNGISNRHSHSHSHSHSHGDCVSTDGGNSNGVYAFIHLDMSSTVGEVVELAHEHALIIDTPITFDGDDMCVTLIGIDTGLRSVLQSLPDAIDVSVRDAGDYDPGTDDLLSPLTDRQLEVFGTAIEHGYYEVPRRATHQDIADELGCAPSTIDEHLRKAESSIIPNLFHA